MNCLSEFLRGTPVALDMPRHPPRANWSISKRPIAIALPLIQCPNRLPGGAVAACRRGASSPYCAADRDVPHGEEVVYDSRRMVETNPQ
jgi:hypothetical protein